jgi:hypothetical protein
MVRVLLFHLVQQECRIRMKYTQRRFRMHFKPSTSRSTILFAVAFTALTGFSELASGQYSSPGTPPSQAAGQTDERTIQTFAVALAEVQDVQIEYIEKIKATNEPAVTSQLQNEARSKMVQAVETKGFSVEQYNSLAQQMQSDPSFRQKVERAMPK